MPLLLVTPPDARFLKGGTENTLLIHIECLCRADLEAVAAADALIGLVGLALLDLDALMPADILAATAQVKMNRLGRDIAADFNRTVKDIPEVTECYNISGQYDYLLKIHAPNMKYYQEFVLNVLGTIPHLGSLESTFVMDEIKHEYGISL